MCTRSCTSGVLGFVKGKRKLRSEMGRVRTAPIALVGVLDESAAMVGVSRMILMPEEMFRGYILLSKVQAWVRVEFADNGRLCDSGKIMFLKPILNDATAATVGLYYIRPSAAPTIPPSQCAASASIQTRLHSYNRDLAVCKLSSVRQRRQALAFLSE